MQVLIVAPGRSLNPLKPEDEVRRTCSQDGQQKNSENGIAQGPVSQGRGETAADLRFGAMAAKVLTSPVPNAPVAFPDDAQWRSLLGNSGLPGPISDVLPEP